MSMPVFADTDIGREEALNMILASIAYEELGLSHVINAEGEKIQRAVGTLDGLSALAESIEDLINIDTSVATLLAAVQETQTALMTKMTAALAADPAAG